MSKTGKKTVKHSSVLEYYQKKGHQINYGIDTIVLDLGLNEVGKNQLIKSVIGYSLNSNVSYYELSGYKDIQLSNTVMHYRSGTAINVTLQHEELPAFPAFQIFTNKQYAKFSMYGLFFRFCELYKIDWRKFASSVLGHFELGQVLTEYRVMRLDYKADILNLEPQKYYTRLKKYNARYKTVIGTKENSYINKGRLETIYLGSKASKYAFCRIYDKYEDTRRKGKQVFYHDYPNPTTRVERQFGSQFIGDNNLDELMYKIAGYCGFETTYEGRYYVANRYDPTVIVNVETYKTKRKNMGEKLVYNGIDIHEELVSLHYLTQTVTKRFKRFSSLHGNNGEKKDT